MRFGSFFAILSLVGIGGAQLLGDSPRRCFSCLGKCTVPAQVHLCPKRLQVGCMQLFNGAPMTPQKGCAGRSLERLCNEDTNDTDEKMRAIKQKMKCRFCAGNLCNNWTFIPDMVVLEYAPDVRPSSLICGLGFVIANLVDLIVFKFQ